MKYNVSDYLRLKPEEQEEAYKEVVNTLVELAKRYWDDNAFYVDITYEKKLFKGMQGKEIYGTTFKVDSFDEGIQDAYKTTVEYNLDKQEISKRFEEELKKGTVINLGDAEVVEGTVLVNVRRESFNAQDAPVGSIYFNCILPEDKEEQERELAPVEEDETEDDK